MFLIISDRNMLLPASIDMKIKGPDCIKQFCTAPGTLGSAVCLITLHLWLFQAQFKTTIQSAFAN